MKYLFIIPARGGSKGIPRKNIRDFLGKPLICHAIDQARAFAPDADICLTTDDPEIKDVAENYGLEVPFLRPDYLASDTAGTYEVLLHALDHYEKQGRKYDAIVLLQPTSPFRNTTHIREAIEKYTPDLDMVVTVSESPANPYYTLFEEDNDGFLRHSKGDGKITRRQDAPKAWEYNGAVYVINPESLKKSKLSEFSRIRKSEMDRLHSLDLDTPLDWKIAELIAAEGLP